MFLETGEEELRKLKDFTIQEMYRVLCEDTGTCAEKGIRNTFRSHGLRKWFNNRLIAAQCDPMIKEFFMGHKIPDKTKASYFVADPTELKEIYTSFIPFLTIQKEADISESPEYQRIKQENVILQAETARHVVERSELQEVKNELERIKSSLNLEDIQNYFKNIIETTQVEILANSNTEEKPKTTKKKQVVSKK